jgi:protein-tyrosine phosphatase
LSQENELSEDSRPKPTASQSKIVDFASVRKVGGKNFRDLGGKPTIDGSEVRRDMLYRSAHLADVPAESPLRTLELRTLVTLQSRIEVSLLGPPAADIFGGVRWEHIPIGDRWFTEPPPKPPPGHEHLIILTQFPEDWRTFFRLIASRDAYPMLFHCSAGRDRTGVGAALLLELLGVERDLIVADFMESNHVFPHLPLEREQLDPVFALIDSHGGIRALMVEVIGLEDSDLDAIRENLLSEPAARDE